MCVTGRGGKQSGRGRGRGGRGGRGGGGRGRAAAVSPVRSPSRSPELDTLYPSGGSVERLHQVQAAGNIESDEIGSDGNGTMTDVPAAGEVAGDSFAVAAADQDGGDGAVAPRSPLGDVGNTLHLHHIEEKNKYGSRHKRRPRCTHVHILYTPKQPTSPSMRSHPLGVA